MPRKRPAKPVTTIVPHRSPRLAQLLQAAATCEVEPLRRFLAAGGLPDALVEREFEDGSTMPVPLIFSAITAHYINVQDPALQHASLELLLQSGVNPNAIFKDANEREDTPLMAACRASCCTAPVRLLLAHGANPALQTSKGEAALHIAASEGRADVCRLLLEAESGCDPDVRDRNGVTPLVCAVRYGHSSVVELLHRQWGADLRVTHPDGDTLLHVAATSGQRPLLEYLLRNGLGVDAATKQAVTPVRIAAQSGNIVAVQTLIDHGASTTAVNEGGGNLLMIAVREGHTGVMQLLLNSRSCNNQAAVDVNATDADGDTALHVAACRDRTEVAALLLQHGAAVNAPNNRGYTPVALAAAVCSAEFVQLLLDAGAELTGDSPVLHVAIRNNKGPAVLQLLLEQSSAGAMIDSLGTQCSCCGPRTPIMMCEQPAHLKLLLAAGADVHKTTDRGNTALHVAAVHKFAAPVLCLLIKAGVDLHAVNIDGKTAAQVAVDSGNTLAAALLTRAARDT
jgi:ankyrin repeat protein